MRSPASRRAENHKRVLGVNEMEEPEYKNPRELFHQEDKDVTPITSTKIAPKKWFFERRKSRKDVKPKRAPIVEVLLE
jgi:hypothetical protein